MKLLQSLRRRHVPDVDALSARLDGRLDAAGAAAFDAHVAGCEACRTEAEGLRVARATLRAMPGVEHPRSFRLRVADVEGAVAKPAGRGAMAARLLPALSGVAAIVFAVAVGADLTSTRGSALMSADNVKVASAPRPEADAARSSSTSAGAAADSAGPVFSVPASTATVRPPAATGAQGDPTNMAGIIVPGLALTPGATSAPSPEAASPQDATAAGAIAPDAGATVAPPTGRGNTAANASPTGELSPASERQSGSGDNDGLRAVEIIAGIVALAAAAGAIALTVRRRGEQS